MKGVGGIGHSDQIEKKIGDKMVMNRELRYMAAARRASAEGRFLDASRWSNLAQYERDRRLKGVAK
jgi:hypothetical protein